FGSFRPHFRPRSGDFRWASSSLTAWSGGAGLARGILRGDDRADGPTLFEPGPCGVRPLAAALVRGAWSATARGRQASGRSGPAEQAPLQGAAASGRTPEGWDSPAPGSEKVS